MKKRVSKSGAGTARLGIEATGIEVLAELAALKAVTVPELQLMLNILLSFAQFEREVIGERIRRGGRTPWPHWHEARRLYAETDPRLLPTQRAVIVRLKLMEKRRSSVPTVKYLARRLK